MLIFNLEDKSSFELEMEFERAFGILVTCSSKIAGYKQTDKGKPVVKRGRKATDLMKIVELPGNYLRSN